jgi:hypothetical protein
MAGDFNTINWDQVLDITNKSLDAAGKIARIVETGVRTAQTIKKGQEIPEKDEFERAEKAYREGKVKRVKVKDLKPGDIIIVDGKPAKFIGFEPALTNDEKVKIISEKIKSGSIFSEIHEISFDKEIRKYAWKPINEHTAFTLGLDDFSFGFSIYVKQEDKSQIVEDEESNKKYAAIMEKYIPKNLYETVGENGRKIRLDNIKSTDDIDIIFEGFRNAVEEAQKIIDGRAFKIYEKLIREFNFSVQEEGVITKEINAKKKISIAFTLHGFFGIGHDEKSKFDEKSKSKYLAILDKYMPEKFWGDVFVTNDFIGGFINFLKIKGNEDIDTIFLEYEKLEQKAMQIK